MIRGRDVRKKNLIPVVRVLVTEEGEGYVKMEAKPRVLRSKLCPQPPEAGSSKEMSSYICSCCQGGKGIHLDFRSLASRTMKE